MRMSHIGICVSDWKRSMRFYHDVLGFEYVSELDVKGEPAATLLELSDVELHAVYLEREGVRIELLYYPTPGHTGDDARRPMNQLGLTHLSLRVDDLDAVLPEVEAAGGRIVERSRIGIEAASTKVIFVTDPDGTRIELVQQPGP